MPTPEAQAAARDLLLAICSVGTEEEIGRMCAEALDRFAAQRADELLKSLSYTADAIKSVEAALKEQSAPPQT